MQRLGHQFLARSRRAFDQHRRHARGYKAHPPAHFEHAGGIPHHLRQALGGTGLGCGRSRSATNRNGLRCAGYQARPNRRCAARGKICRDELRRTRWLRQFDFRQINFGQVNFGQSQHRPSCVHCGSRVPRRCVVLLAAAQCVEQFLPVRSARALFGARAFCSHHINSRKLSSEVTQELAQIQIRQPRVDNHRLGMRGLGLAPRLGAALCLANLPAQAGEDLCEPLAEAAVGARDQRGTGPDARMRRKNRNGKRLHESSP